MIYITNAIASISIIIFISLLGQKGYINSEVVSLDKRKIHKNKVIRIGGIVFLSLLINFYYLNNNDLILLLLFSYLFLLIGLMEDIYMKINKYHRLILIISFLFFYIFYFAISINHFEIQFLNNLFKDNFLLIQFFCFLGFLILINGFNFIDGLNGLLLGYTAIILSLFIFFTGNNFFELSFFLNLALTSVCILFFVNFVFGKILAGDGGSYFLGFLIGGISILLANNGILSPIEIACIIYYPVIELIYTILRRVFINKKNPFKPDDQHFHTIFYYIINKKFTKNESFISNNSLASLFINIYIFLTIVVALSLSKSVNPLIIYVILNVQYIIINIYLYRYQRSKNKEQVNR